jgi:hypothetical protein
VDVDHVSNFSLITQKFARRPLLWFLFGGLVFLYFSLFVLPLTPIFLEGDQFVFLLNSKRMLEGQVIYQDFHQHMFPGTEVFYLPLLKLFGARDWIPNAMLIILGLSLAWLTIVISKKIMSGSAAFLPGALFLTVGFGFLDAAHHWYSALAIMAAVAVIIEKRTLARLAVAGTLCGVATFFTQTRGLVAVIGLSLFLLWEGRQKRENWQIVIRRAAYLLSTFVASVGTVTAYFIWKVGLQRFFDCTVTFILYYYSAETRSNTFQVWLEGLLPITSVGILPYKASWLLIYALIPSVYVVFLLIYWSKVHVEPKEHWNRLILLNIMGLFLFIGVANAPSWTRLCTVSPPAFILLGWMLSSQGKLYHTLTRLFWVAVLIWATFGPLHNQIRKKWAYLDAPSGRIAFSLPVSYEKYQWLLQRTRPGEFFFHASYSPYFYYPLDLRNPAEVSFVSPNDYTRPEQVRNIVEALEKHQVRFVLWSTDVEYRDDSHPANDHLGPLRAYVRNSYHVIETFPDLDQIWERNTQ